MRDARSRLDRLRDELAAVPGDAAEAATSVFDTVDGLTVRAEWAPDRDDYPETDAGQREYLRDCHAAAREQLAAAVTDLGDAHAALADAADEYPAAGDRSRGGEAARDAFDDAGGDILAAVEAVADLRETLEKIEAETGEHR